MTEPRRIDRFDVQLSLQFDSWWNDTPFSCLLEDVLVSQVAETQRTLFNRKAQTVIHKWSMLQIAGAELAEVCRFVLRTHGPDAPEILYSIHLYLTLKIESYLVLARSILDILSGCLAMSLTGDSGTQSFNALRKRRDIPPWLSEYVEHELRFDRSQPVRNIGWLSLLISDDKHHQQSLRDFVAHRGVAQFVFQEHWPGEFQISFQPRKNDGYIYPVLGVTAKISEGLLSLATLLNEKLIGPIQQ